MRSLENLRRTLEDLYVKSNAEGTTAEDQAAFSPELIAQAHEAARRDNARAIVSWARAIYDELQAQAQEVASDKDSILNLKKELLVARDRAHSLGRTLVDIEKGRAFPTLSVEARQHQAEVTQRALQQTEDAISQLEQDLRDLRQPASAIPGRPPQEGSTGTLSSGRHDLDGSLPPLP